MTIPRWQDFLFKPRDITVGYVRIGSFASMRSTRFSGRMSVAPRKRQSATKMRPVVKGHVWTAPSWQGESSRRRLGSMQPCVRPLRAVHMTAGHNALRGSGPGQKPAFENAVAHVGCPDRRIDRLCITCCSPSQPSHHAMVRGAISSDPQRGWIIVSLAPSHHGPGHSGELVG